MSRLPRLPKPLYESLPFCYAGAGLALLAASYALSPGWVSTAALLAGLAGLLGGLVVWLRRRDYRAMRTRYRSGKSLPD